MRTAKVFASLCIAAVLLWTTGATAACVGDCDGGGSVEINELIVGVNIALGMAQAAACPAFDADASDTVTIQELIAAVNNALRACPATPTASATSTDSPPPEATPTATSTSELTATPTAVPPATATATTVAADTATATLAPTATATTAASTATATSVATETATIGLTSTSAASPTGTPTSGSETPSASPTLSLTATTSASATPSGTPTQGAGDTSTPTGTFTPTFTPTMGPSAVCGNGILEPSENCTDCAADCAVGQCSATASMASFQISFQGPPGTTPITATTLLGYRSDRVSIPGSGNVLSVRQRVVFPPPLPNTIAINDLDYAVRVVLGRTAGIAAGLLYTATFDTCQGAPAVHAEDFACTMEACAGAGGAIAGCTCTVVEP